MTRDKTFAKSILQFVETHDQSRGVNTDMAKLALVNYPAMEDSFNYHLDLLVGDGYLRREFTADHAQSFLLLTWTGHDLLETL